MYFFTTHGQFHGIITTLTYFSILATETAKWNSKTYESNSGVVSSIQSCSAIRWWLLSFVAILSAAMSRRPQLDVFWTYPPFLVLHHNINSRSVGISMHAVLPCFLLYRKLPFSRMILFTASNLRSSTVFFFKKSAIFVLKGCLLHFLLCLWLFIPCYELSPPTPLATTLNTEE